MATEVNQPIEISNSMLISASSFSTLKRILIENIGMDKTRSCLFRLGYDIGISAAQSKAPVKDLESQRGKKSMHAMYGQVRDVIINPDFEQLLNGTISKIEGKWIDSFEADVHLKYFAQTTECVCYTLCGYVNGFLWHKYRAPLVTIETKCKARGDACCEFEIRLEENWMPEHEHIINIYRDTALTHEVNMTYDALLHQKHLVDKISTFYTMLTESVTARHSMEQVLQKAYDYLQIPILIENLHGEILIQTGLSLEQEKRLQNGYKNFSYLQSYGEAQLLEGKSYYKLMLPVLINKKPNANCCFLYSNAFAIDENDHLFLERIANVTALCFLYETAQYEEQDRLSHTILDRLSHQQYQTLKDLEPYFKLYTFKMKPPYYVMSLSITNNAQIGETVDVHEHLQYFSKLFQQYGIDSIFSSMGDRIVFLIVQPNSSLIQMMTSIIETIQKRYPANIFKLGISNAFNSLDLFVTAKREANLAQRLPSKNNVIHYTDLGILGKFVSNMDNENLQEMARDMLQELYDFEDVRKKELLYSLYRYLANGQKLKETMADLLISLGGLQYRLRQIEALLNHNLKDAQFTSYLLLILEALILTNELDFNEFQ